MRKRPALSARFSQWRKTASRLLFPQRNAPKPTRTVLTPLANSKCRTCWAQVVWATKPAFRSLEPFRNCPAPWLWKIVCLNQRHWKTRFCHRSRIAGKKRSRWCAHLRESLRTTGRALRKCLINSLRVKPSRLTHKPSQSLDSPCITPAYRWAGFWIYLPRRERNIERPRLHRSWRATEFKKDSGILDWLRMEIGSATFQLGEMIPRLRGCFQPFFTSSSRWICLQNRQRFLN